MPYSFGIPFMLSNLRKSDIKSITNFFNFLKLGSYKANGKVERRSLLRPFIQIVIPQITNHEHGKSQN